MALYVFCFAPPDLPAAPPGAGLDGLSALALERFAAASAVVSNVLPEEFCGPRAEERLQDLAWVGPRACRHEQVVEEVMHRSAVLPARFATIFSTHARLEDFVDRNAAAISGFFARLDGREEWAVKGWLDRAGAIRALSAAELARRQPQLEAMTPGRRHLEQQRLRAAAGSRVHRWLEESGRDAAAILATLAPQCTQRHIVRPRDPANSAEMVFNWAFLISREQREPFRAQVERASDTYANQGLAFTLSGPWPPYSFVPELSSGTCPDLTSTSPAVSTTPALDCRPRPVAR